MPRDTVPLSSKPWENIFWMIWIILLTQHSMLRKLFTVEVNGKHNGGRGWIILNTTVYGKFWMIHFVKLNTKKKETFPYSCSKSPRKNECRAVIHISHEVIKTLAIFPMRCNFIITAVDCHVVYYSLISRWKDWLNLIKNTTPLKLTKLLILRHHISWKKLIFLY